MTKSLIKVQFICPETGEAFSTAADAEKSAEKARNEAAREALQKAKNSLIRDSFRLELEDIRDFAALLNNKVKKHIGVDIGIKVTNLQFGVQSCSGSAPIGERTNWCARDKDLPTAFLGWRGTISGKYAKKNNKQINCDTITGRFCFSDYQTKFGGFSGVNTGSGGRRDNSWYYDCTVFLSDFPKLAAKYKQFERVKSLKEARDRKVAAENNRIFKEATQLDAVVELANKREAANYAARKAEEARAAIVSEYIKDSPLVLVSVDVSEDFNRLSRELSTN